MRPKKRILLIDTNEVRLSAHRYMLYIRGFAVFSAASAAEGRAACVTAAPDLVIAMAELPELRWLFGLLHDEHPGIRQIIVAPPRGECTIPADSILYGPSPSEIYDWARMLTARKRGPKKRPVSVNDRNLADGVYANWIVQNGQAVRRSA